MSTQDMIDNFLLQYDLNGSGAVAGFTDDEIIEFLNKAQLDIVKKGFLESGPSLFHVLIDYQGFILVETIPEFNMPKTYKSENADFPTDFLFYITSHTHITKTQFPTIQMGDWVENRAILPKDLFKFRSNESDKVIFYNPVVMISSHNLEVTVDTYTTIVGNTTTEVSCTMSYLRHPIIISSVIVPTVSGDCELEERWHQEIVNSALTNAMMVVNDVRMRRQTKGE